MAAPAAIQSFTLPRQSHAFPNSLSQYSAYDARRSKSARLPAFAGLKMRPAAAVRSFQSGITRRGGIIVCEKQETAIEVAEVTDETWKSLVLGSDSPVLVEFWAPWCGPCRMMHPVMDELAKEFAGKLKCCKINTDQSPSIASQYGIRSIPTVMIFKNGEKMDAFVGAVPKKTLTTNIEKYL